MRKFLEWLVGLFGYALVTKSKRMVNGPNYYMVWSRNHPVVTMQKHRAICIARELDANDKNPRVAEYVPNRWVNWR